MLSHRWLLLQKQGTLHSSAACMLAHIRVQAVCILRSCLDARCVYQHEATQQHCSAVTSLAAAAETRYFAFIGCLHAGSYSMLWLCLCRQCAFCLGVWMFTRCIATD